MARAVSGAGRVPESGTKAELFFFFASSPSPSPSLRLLTSVGTQEKRREEIKPQPSVRKKRSEQVKITWIQGK